MAADLQGEKCLKWVYMSRPVVGRLAWWYCNPLEPPRLVRAHPVFNLDVPSALRCTQSSTQKASTQKGGQQKNSPMQVKIYIPHIVEIPNDYIPVLLKRASDSLGRKADTVPATRGYLIRQAIKDGLIREFDHLISEDGTVDIVCDPGEEIALEYGARVLNLNELLDALQSGQLKAGDELEGCELEGQNCSDIVQFVRKAG